jgi:copper chaperone CopZ
MAAIVDMGISRTDQLSLLRLPAEKLVLLPSPRYPSMPRFAVSRPHCNIDKTEIRSAIFKVEGMVCAACAGSVEKAVKRLPGIEDATVALLRNKAQVFYRPAFVEVTYTSGHHLLTCPSLLFPFTMHAAGLVTTFLGSTLAGMRKRDIER